MPAIDPDASVRKSIKLPLAIKFFLSSALLISLAVGAAIVVTYVKGGRIAEREVDRALATSLAVQKEFEQNRLDNLQLIVQLIAADPSVVRYVAGATDATSGLPGLSDGNASDNNSIPDLLKERQNQYGFDLGIVLDASGNVLGRSDQTEAFQESLADDALVRPAVAKASPFSGYWRQGDRLFLAAIMPLQQDQNLVGFLLLAQNVNDALSRKIAKISGAQIAFWLPTAQRLMLVASSFDEATATQMKEALDIRSSELLPVVHAGKSVSRLSLIFSNQTWVAEVTPTAAEGEGSLGTVLSLTSTDQMLAGYRDILNWVVLAGLISIAAALLLSYLLSKGILRPVRAMARAAEQAAAGNYQTHLGLHGKDELARLSRAFDSLLSDLREKSDIEGYVGHLARFLPEPGREERRIGSLTEAAKPEPLQRRQFAVLGLEFRSLAKLSSDTGSEDALSAFTKVLASLTATAQEFGGALRALAGGQFMICFNGEERLLAALHATARIFDHAQSAGLTAPAVALASGDILRAQTTSNGQTYRVMLGTALAQLDRLIPEAAPGQALLTRSTGEELQSALGPQRFAVANGRASGKRYFAVAPQGLQELPALAYVNTTRIAPAETDTVRPDSSELTANQFRRSGLETGQIFGNRFEILSLLGSGGMGMVYKAQDLELDDVVALKMLKPSLMMDNENLDRLKSEIKLARRITHPNVLRTFDFGEFDSRPYISMEYVRGMTLRYLLSETGRIPYSAGLRIARQLAAGLKAAHEVGVLHRDIKPENLILESNGNAKLMDFGIARPTRRATPGHTQPGTFLGTPNYSAPEQLAGEEIDERADIYSCGVLMCEMFGGKLPFSGSNTMEIYLAQMQQQPIKPSEYWPEIPSGLESIILRCLEKNPTDRFQSAEELFQALAKLRS